MTSDPEISAFFQAESQCHCVSRMRLNERLRPQILILKGVDIVAFMAFHSTKMSDRVRVRKFSVRVIASTATSLCKTFCDHWPKASASSKQSSAKRMTFFMFLAQSL